MSARTGAHPRQSGDQEWQPQWHGPTRPYDLLREGTIALLIVTLVAVALAALLSSPDTPPVTLRSWSLAAPADFVTTAASELDGTSESSTYGPPYNHATAATDTVQNLGFFSPQRWVGVIEPVHPAQDFVLDPLARAAALDSTLAAALRTYTAASVSQQRAWTHAFVAAVAHTSVHGPHLGTVVAPQAGPVPTMLSAELALAQSGALDSELISHSAFSFYGNNYTKPLLFVADSSYFTSLAAAQHMVGNQWGVMNETGSYPGQPWLWLYTMWYQLPWFSASDNVDLIAMMLTTVASLALLFVPFIPGLRDLPRKVGIYRLIWRTHYRRVER